jgi:HAD superfamily hydrolase (TIGR01450 family)
MTAESPGEWLRGCDGPLSEEAQRFLIDLDGVVVLDEQPIAGAGEAIEELRSAGKELRFVTNNASRPPAAVAAMLEQAGLHAATEEVVTSAMAAASLLAERYPPGSPVLVVGGEGVRAALSDSGLRPVDRVAEQPVAVLQGFAPEVDWSMLAEAAVALRAGAAWIATNTDRTLPSPRGPLPGNGSLVAALATATGLQPESVGKPDLALYDAALYGADRDGVLAIGDRLDTDIAGARATGIRSMLVLTGVSTAADLLRAPPAWRPDYLGRDLAALRASHPPATVSHSEASAGAARVELVARNEVRVDAGPGGPDGLDGLRALCALAWSTAGADVAPTTYENALKSLDLNLR